MPLFKRTFTSGKMNKDMDERIVPDGEYRDALNIEVQSSEESNVGSAQTILGNTLISDGLVPEGSTCVASIAYNKEDKIYYFVTGPEFVAENDWNKVGAWKDYIIEYDIKTESFKYVFVDIYAANFKVDSALFDSSSPSNISEAITLSASGTNPYTHVRNGMFASIFRTNATPVNFLASTNKSDLTVSTYDDTESTGEVRLFSTDINFGNSQNQILPNDYINFSADRVLNFHKDRHITGVNIIDGMIFWTDNHTEPKKINIERCIGGTGGSVALPPSLTGSIFDGDNDFYHTRLCVTPDKDRNLMVKRRKWDENTQVGQPWYVKEENITVIRKGPLSAPILLMSENEDEDRLGPVFASTDGTPSDLSGTPDAAGVNGNSFSYTATNGFGYIKKVGETIVNVKVDDPVHWKVGDMIIFNQDQDDNTSLDQFTEHDVRATIIAAPSPSSMPSKGPYDFLIESIDKEAIDQENKVWNLRLEQKEPLFEFKFPRFAYRYKYEDGEYSQFSPFSEPAFLPGPFDFLPKKAYNLGMTNRLRSLKIMNYVVEDSLRPQDVVEIDLLYKDEVSPTIYTVETIKMTDGWIEDEDDLLLWPDSINGPKDSSGNPLVDPSEYHRGEYEVTSELIHATVPSNQLLRQWDNVPRKALAQEISSNRLVYGNYLQNYNLTSNFVEGEVKPKILVTLQAGEADLNAVDAELPPGEDEYNITINLDPDTKDFYASGVPNPHKTVRSLREYQIGVVYGDEYGRETPVLAGKGGTGTLKVPKQHSSTINKIKAQIITDHPSWAKYFKFFVKETSNEYYNMAMDRWYDAEDGNIWMSFASADRNKVDEESFIILKKRHDSHRPVTDLAKYKIIAIENEAPPFIKTNVKKLGQVVETSPGVVGSAMIGSTTLGFPMNEYDEIWVRATAPTLQNIFDATTANENDDNSSQSLGTIYDQIKNGVFYLRVRTTAVKSEWYQVTKMTNKGAYWRFKLDNPMKEDVEFASTNGTFSGAVQGLAIEFANHHVENKKEFEGRFFVKIYKDLVLQENLLLPKGKNWKPVNAARLGFWNTPEGNRGENVTTGLFSSGTSQKWYSFGLNCNAQLDHDTCFKSSSHTSNFNNNFKVNGSSRTAQDRVLFFQTANNGFRDGEYGCSISDGVARRTTRTWFENSHSLLFIDRTKPRACQGSYFNEDSRNAGRGSKWGRGVHKGTNGIEQGAMDIGYVHARNFGSGMQQTPANFDEREEFLDQIFRKGATWRFREDPDGIVYRTTGVFHGKKTWSETHEEYGHWGQLGVFHTHSQYSSANRGNNMSRFRLEFEMFDDPGKGLGHGKSGYHPIGGKPQTKIENTPELGYWGGRQIADKANKGGEGPDGYLLTNSSSYLLPNIVSSPSLGLPVVGVPPFFTHIVPASMKGGGSDTNMHIPMPPGYEDPWVDANASTRTDIDGNTVTGIEQARRWRQHASKYHHIEIVESKSDNDDEWSSMNPAMWETEPKEDVGMDIYYEASDAIPITINAATNELFAPIKTLVNRDYQPYPGQIHVVSWSANEVKLTTPVTYRSGDRFRFTRLDGFVSTCTVEAPLDSNGVPIPFPTLGTSDILKVRGWEQAAKPTSQSNNNDSMHNQPYTLSWFNAYCFGNGIESDRIRDDFNQSTLANGVKASTVLAEQYKEDHRKTGLIHSGIYNSTSNVNRLNQFLTAEKITKDMNPSYGSIQKLHTRDTNIVVLHEDKCMKVLADKDALFNADGSQNVAISSKFLGTDQPFSTKYGISTNPESCAVDLAGRLYFTDRARSAVLRLSLDGLTNIADYGMKDWFKDNLNPLTQKILGSYDTKKGEYNLTITGLYPSVVSSTVGTNSVNACGCVPTLGGSGTSTGSVGLEEKEYTLSFSEQAKGWISFKSFIPENGVSINREYYTFKDGEMYKHHSNETHNNFYDEDYDSSITLLFNDQPGDVKSFSTLNYEGTQAKISLNALDNDYYNLQPKSGWYISNIKTNLQDTSLLEFKEKEGKWFTTIKGDTTTLQNLDEAEFSVQGIGNYERMTVTGAEMPTTRCLTITPYVDCDVVLGCTDPNANNYNPLATQDDGSCTYDTPVTYNCIDGNCIDPGDGTGYYQGQNALTDCQENCEQENPCNLAMVVTSFNPAGLTTFEQVTGITYPSNLKKIQFPGAFGEVTLTPLATTSMWTNSNVYIDLDVPYFYGSFQGQWGAPAYAYPGDGASPSYGTYNSIYNAAVTSGGTITPTPNVTITPNIILQHTNAAFTASSTTQASLGDPIGPFGFNSFLLGSDKPGTYWFKVEDQAGCSEIVNVTLNEPIVTAEGPPCDVNGTIVADATDASWSYSHYAGEECGVIMSHVDFGLFNTNTAQLPANWIKVSSIPTVSNTYDRVEYFEVRIWKTTPYQTRLLEALTNSNFGASNGQAIAQHLFSAPATPTTQNGATYPAISQATQLTNSVIGQNVPYTATTPSGISEYITQEFYTFADLCAFLNSLVCTTLGQPLYPTPFQPGVHSLDDVRRATINFAKGESSLFNANLSTGVPVHNVGIHSIWEWVRIIKDVCEENLTQASHG